MLVVETVTSTEGGERAPEGHPEFTRRGNGRVRAVLREADSCSLRRPGPRLAAVLESALDHAGDPGRRRAFDGAPRGLLSSLLGGVVASDGRLAHALPTAAPARPGCCGADHRRHPVSAQRAPHFRDLDALRQRELRLPLIGGASRFSNGVWPLLGRSCHASANTMARSRGRGSDPRSPSTDRPSAAPPTSTGRVRSWAPRCSRMCSAGSQKGDGCTWLETVSTLARSSFASSILASTSAAPYH